MKANFIQFDELNVFKNQLVKHRISILFFMS